MNKAFKPRLYSTWSFPVRNTLNSIRNDEHVGEVEKIYQFSGERICLPE